MDSISYGCISWSISHIRMSCITFERGDPKFGILPLERLPSAQPCSSVSCEQNGCYVVPGASFLAPRSSDLTPCDFLLWGVHKRINLCTNTTNNFGWPKKNHITIAVNSVTQDILLWVWDEFSYRLDILAAWEGCTLNIYKLYCEYNQMYFVSYLSVVLCFIYRLTNLSPSFWITQYNSGTDT
jgi:hypothetical protein